MAEHRHMSRLCTRHPKAVFPLVLVLLYSAACWAQPVTDATDKAALLAFKASAALNQVGPDVATGTAVYNLPMHAMLLWPCTQ